MISTGSTTVRRVVAVAAVVLALTGCTEVTPPPVETRVDVDTPALRAAKAEAKVAPCPRLEGTSELPEQELACLGGGRAVDLSSIEGPAVIPMWASWCTPCRKELPLYQRLHERAGDRVSVVGIDYQDTQPDVAIDLLRRTGARFPQLADPGGAVADTYRVRGLPSVLWVREDGSVEIHNDQPASYAELVTLVSDRLDVDIRSTPAG